MSLGKKNNGDFLKIDFDKTTLSKRKFFFIGIIILVIIIAFLVYTFVVQAEPIIKMVSGTEYISNEEGQIIVRLQDNAGNNITDASCRVSLLYPDKSYVFIDQDMIPTTVPVVSNAPIPSFV